MERLPGYSSSSRNARNTQEILLGTRRASPPSSRRRSSSRRLHTPGRTAHSEAGRRVLPAPRPPPREHGRHAASAFRPTWSTAPFPFPSASTRRPGAGELRLLGDLNSMGLDCVYGKEAPPKMKLPHAGASEFRVATVDVSAGSAHRGRRVVRFPHLAATDCGDGPPRCNLPATSGPGRAPPT